MDSATKEKLAKLETQVLEFGMAALQRRINRLERRWLVFCPWLRCKWLLRKIHKMRELSSQVGVVIEE